MKRPRVYIHVGEPKTGTTFLQQVMWANRRQLARQGVLLPGHSLQDHYRANQDLRGIAQADDDPSGSWSGEWDILAEQARKAGNTAVISHELLAGASGDQAKRAVASLQPAEVHIVLTVRDFATLLPAEWQETVKHRNRQSWEEWLSSIIDKKRRAPGRRRRWFWRAHDTLDVLARWSQQVPGERVHVITVPPRGSAPDLLWERFATVIGVDPQSVDTSRARANASLGLAEVELLRRLNTALPQEVPGWFYASRVKETLAHQVLAARPTAGRLQLPLEREQWARRQSRRLIKGLRESGYDIVGELDELLPVPSAREARHPDEVTAEEVLDAAVDAVVATLVREHQGLRRGSSSSGGLVDRARAAVRSSVPFKRRVRELSNRHASLRRVRIVSWSLAARARAAARHVSRP